MQESEVVGKRLNERSCQGLANKSHSETHVVAIIYPFISKNRLGTLPKEAI